MLPCCTSRPAGRVQPQQTANGDTPQSDETPNDALAGTGHSGRIIIALTRGDWTGEQLNGPTRAASARKNAGSKPFAICQGGHTAERGNCQRGQEERAHVRNHRCQRCPRAWCRKAVIFCVRMLKNVELFTIPHRKLRNFKGGYKVQNEGSPQRTAGAAVYAHREPTSAESACPRTPLGAVVASRRCRQRR